MCFNRMKYVNSNMMKNSPETIYFGSSVYGCVHCSNKCFSSVSVAKQPLTFVKSVKSMLKVISVGSHTFLESVGPAVSHGVMEFCDWDESNFLIDALLQFFEILEHNTPEILL